MPTHIGPDGQVVRDGHVPPKRRGDVSTASRRWRAGRWIAVVVAVAAAYVTNPGTSIEGFRNFLRAQRTFAVTHRMAEAFGLIDVEVSNLHFASVGREGSRVFVGAFDQWIELPTNAFRVGQMADLGWSEERDMDALIFAFATFFVLFQVFPRAMDRHCVASCASLRAGRVWSIGFAQMSHAHLQHLIMNILFLLSIGPQVHEMVGRHCFFALFFLGGGCAIVGSLVLSPLFLQGRPVVECLGASGSLYVLLGYFIHRASARSTHIRWMSLDLEWGAFALLQLVIGGASGLDVVAHVIGMGLGWLTAQYQLLEIILAWKLLWLLH